MTAFGGRSLQVIADELGEKYASFWNWVKGRTGMPPHVLAEIGRRTGYSLNWMLTGEGDPKTVEAKEYSDEDLAIIVSNRRYGGFFTIEGFVFELARINHRFRDMLTPDALRDVKEVHDEFLRVVAGADAYTDAVVEYGRAVRKAGDIEEPDESVEIKPLKPKDVMIAPVVARIGPPEKVEEQPVDEAEEIRRRLIGESEIDEIERRLKGKRRRTG